MTGVVFAANGFSAHTGPVLRLGDSDSRRFLLRLDTHHLNFAGRFHGGMVMTLLSTTMGQVATDLTVRAVPGASASMLSLNCDFISTAEGGAEIIAEVSVTRTTRSVLFLTCRLFAGEQVLTAASAIYKIVAPVLAIDPIEPPVLDLSTLSAAEGWTPVPMTEPFGLHVGPVFERITIEGERVIRFSVEEHRLDQHGLGLVHDGMLLFVADLFTGKAAVHTAGRICVTLAMQARRLGDAKLGDWVDFQPRVQLATPSVVLVDGSFHSAGKPLMNVSSVWKVLGAP